MTASGQPGFAIPRPAFPWFGGNEFPYAAPVPFSPPPPPPPPFVAAPRPGVGGSLYAGWTASYYPTADLSGSVGFTRKEVRVNFVWPAGHKPGGSPSVGFVEVPADGWSTRFIGSVKSRKSEDAIFRVVVSGKVRLYGRVNETGSYATLIDNWSTGAARTLDSDPVTLDTADVYQLKAEWAPDAGVKTFKLLWKTPSMADFAVIEPVVRIGEHSMTKAELWANLMRQGRTDGSPTTADGNPIDGQEIAISYQESLNLGLDVDPLTRGRCNVKFRGQATLTAEGNQLGDLTSSYDAPSDTTTGHFTIAPTGSNASRLRFVNPIGVSQIEYMKATAPDAVTCYQSGVTFDPYVRDALRTAVSIARNQNYQSSEVNWSDRTPPTFNFQHNGKDTATPVDFPFHVAVPTTPNGWSYEYIIRLANEAGWDVHISVPVQYTNDAIAKLAQLFAFGSDATGAPYTSVQTSPVNPPLNPNLQVLYEMGNELWNPGGPFYYLYWLIRMMGTAEKDSGSPLGLLLHPTDESIRASEWVIARLRQWAKILRDTVTGEPGNRQFIYFGWQYGDIQQTGSYPISWMLRKQRTTDITACGIDDVPIYRDLQYGGGAGYYACNNNPGRTDLGADKYCLTPTVGSGSGFALRPGGTVHTFSGSAGIVNAANITIAPPGSRTQVAWMAGTGSITVSFTTPAGQVSGYYAFAFQALNRETTKIKVDLIKDLGTGGEANINAKYFSQDISGIIADKIGDIDGWRARLVPYTSSDYYVSSAVLLGPNEAHTFTIKAEGSADDTITSGDPVLLICELRVLSIDAIENSFPAVVATDGQTPLDGTFGAEAKVAVAFGMTPHVYESGWSLGQDDGGTQLQLIAKYLDARTPGQELIFKHTLDRAGIGRSIRGTYSMQPNWQDPYALVAGGDAGQGLINYTSQNLPSGMIDSTNELPATITYGLYAPCLLSNSPFTDTAADGWLSWIFVVETAGFYTITGANLSGGTLELAGDPVVSGASVFLELGQYGVRVVSAAGQVPNAAATVTVIPTGAPVGGAAISGLAGTVLSWSAVSGATGYAVRWGTTTGVYTSRATSGTTSLDMDTLLVDGEVSYIAVAATNASGESLTGPERTICLGNGGPIGRWRITSTPTIVSDMLVEATVTVGNIVVGAGWSDAGTHAVQQGYDILYVSSGFAETSHAAAYAANRKYGFTVTPTGDPITIGVFRFVGITQGGPPATVQFYVDGTPFGSPVDIATSTVTEAFQSLIDLTAAGPLASATLIELTFSERSGFGLAAIGKLLTDPTSLQLNGTVIVPAIALDGTDHKNITSGTGTTLTLTTTGAGIVCLATLTNSGNGISSISSPNTTGWAQRAALGGSQLEFWTGKSIGALTGEVITVTLAGGTGFTTIDVWGIKNGDRTTVFDPNGALPASDIGHDPPTSDITTDTADCFLVGIIRNTVDSAPVEGSGWTPISGADYLLTEYKIVSSPQTALAVTSASSGSGYCIADAVKKA